MAKSKAAKKTKASTPARKNISARRKQADYASRERKFILTESQSITQQLIEVLPNPIFFKGTDGRYLGVNKAWEAYFAKPRDAFLGKTVFDLYPDDPEIAQRLHADDQALWDHPGSREYETTVTTPDGKTHDAIYYKATFKDSDGTVAGLVCTIIDITERKQSEKALRNREAELRLLTDNVPAMILYVDRKMRCIFANKRYADFFGLAVADLVGRPLRQIVGNAAFPAVKAHFNKALEGHPVAYQRTVQLKRGEQRYIEVKIVPRATDHGQIPGCYFMALDITEQKRAEDRIRHVAEHDSLTGLPNRLLFNDRLGQAICLARRNTRQFALLYLDLDKFKVVNDTLGHDCGDQLLKKVAERIRGQVRESDTVARVGGDEFTVILYDTSKPQDIEAVARKIIAALTAPYRLRTHPQPIEIGTSIGIAIYPGDAKDHETLIKKADVAMYDAKTQGNSFRFSGN